ncbi:FecR family protein [Enhydrobacter aerosaccus]|uniref:FecR family protein n=1 Tax=Enhydrobacter aerosaccus TaxID=225324 RepID=A0A1T4N7M0_9HYPH|nr:DUF6600 domain-containing protein [Enhydrobacter aerosaccus]SJZ75173.1 FecR family protein [Enhydrobacter aerosaccus]
MKTYRRVCALVSLWLVASIATAHAQSDPPANPPADPPARVGRLAFLQGVVSFHDAQQDAWSPAARNMPLTTGDSLWTEPDGHDEITVAGLRARMDGDTQLDMLALDDSQTRLQLDRGRLDIRTFAFDRNTPYRIVTPRGTVSLLDQGDYYLHAGSTDDPTVLGVRAGTAEIETPDGQRLTVPAGQEGIVSGAGGALQLRLVQTAPPPMPAYWADRDRAVSYQPPPYMPADVTGYEDLAVYGTWRVDPDYGEVWYPNAMPADWQPYSTGYWRFIVPWGWTWMDAHPWGFAPYHYGRWAHRGDRWCWIPPYRRERPVYAPALVAFVGGAELGAALGGHVHAPVGWFPLGPHEPYVPPYTADRGYYRRINASAGVEQAVLDEHWRHAREHEALHDERSVNRAFATVVPGAAFVRSQPVSQSALTIAPNKLAALPVAPVAAPPAPSHAVATTGAAARPDSPPPITLPTARTPLSGMETLGRPTAVEHPSAPGPRIVGTQAPPTGGKSALPPLAPHVAPAPASPDILRPSDTHAPAPIQAIPHAGETPRIVTVPHPAEPHAPAAQIVHPLPSPAPQPHIATPVPARPPAPPQQALAPVHPTAPPAPAPHPALSGEHEGRK